MVDMATVGDDLGVWSGDFILRGGLVVFILRRGLVVVILRGGLVVMLRGGLIVILRGGLVVILRGGLVVSWGLRNTCWGRQVVLWG
jgi:hypothetical protein